MKDVKTIIFDYDGTLHNSTKIYVEAFRQVYREMVSAKDAPEREFQDEEITKWLGYSVQDMWDSFMPEFSQRKSGIKKLFSMTEHWRRSGTSRIRGITFFT